MNTPTHAFPLPQTETAKLETVTHELRCQPTHNKLADYVRANRWQWVLIVALLGVLTGLWARSHH